jgi:hypothetical protein
MTDQFGPNEQTCLLNASAQCDRIWVFQQGGLRLSHFQSLGQEKPILEGCDATIGFGRAQISDSAAYRQCVRGCLGPRL